jgi:hypothetical protein
MAVCEWCDRDMLDPATETCGSQFVEFPDGRAMRPVMWDGKHGSGPDGRCHDCGIKVGGIHHPGCDVEECPRCGGQLISCGCLDDDEEETE